METYSLRLESSQRLLLFLVTLSALAIVLLFWQTPVIHAATINVQTLNDEATTNTACSLREAITNANLNMVVWPDCLAGTGNDIITFSVAGTIVLSSTLGALPSITDAAGLTIEGGNAITISGNNAVQAFHNAFGAITTIQNIVVRNTKVTGSGGAINNSGTLTLTSSTIYSNTATSSGGAILNGGTLFITNSVVYSNSTPYGGGIANIVTGTLTISNSSIYSNAAATSGGGIYNSGGALYISGSNVYSNTASTRGGGIYVSSGALVLTSTNVYTNTAAEGGGIRGDAGSALTLTSSNIYRNAATLYGGGIHNNGTLTVTSSNVYSNVASYGGGINQGFGASTLTNSGIYSNTAVTYGGGIYINSGTLSLGNGNVYGNAANNAGGGISNSGMLNVIDSTFSNNRTVLVSSYGGAVYNAGTAAVLRSTVSDNISAGEGGGIFNNFVSTATIHLSTIITNAATSTSGVGGGISNYGTLTATNSTVSGNTANSHGGGIQNTNSGSDTMSLNNVTITNNTADNDNNGTGNGGGIHATNGVLYFKNTIVAGNTDMGNQAPDCSSAYYSSQGYNLVGKGDLCFFAANTGDQVGSIASPVDPLLGPLANNGGTTLTHALNPGSPAINAGNPAAVGSGGNACAATDQRGTSRFIRCDIGAYEVPNTIIPLYLPLILK